MSTQHAQYMLLFLVLVVNSELHALTPAAHSYALLLCGTGCWQSHLPPVSNPSSEGGEIGQHPVISHHIREEGAVGATSAKAVTH